MKFVKEYRNEIITAILGAMLITLLALWYLSL